MYDIYCYACKAKFNLLYNKLHSSGEYFSVPSAWSAYPVESRQATKTAIG